MTGTLHIHRRGGLPPSGHVPVERTVLDDGLPTIRVSMLGSDRYPESHLRYGYGSRSVRCDKCHEDYLPQHVHRWGTRGRFHWLCGNCSMATPEHMADRVWRNWPVRRGVPLDKTWPWRDRCELACQMKQVRARVAKISRAGVGVAYCGKHEIKWCFGCRQRTRHLAVMSYDIWPSYYDPNHWWACTRCQQDRTAFPGTR